jgi:hypothetical protein
LIFDWLLSVDWGLLIGRASGVGDGHAVNHQSPTIDPQTIKDQRSPITN